MTDRLQFWQKHLRTLSDHDLCAVTARGLHRDELRGLLEVICERMNADDSLLLERRGRALYDIWHRKWSPYCVDCGVDVHEINEYYMVRDEVWNTAVCSNRYRSLIYGQLCIGRLETRIKRTLMSCDFTDAPINTERQYLRSDRLRDRLTAQTGSVNGLDGLIAWAVEGMIEKLPEDRRAAARAAWDAGSDG